MKYLFALIIVITVAQLGLLIFNRPLFCKIAMLGTVTSVPTICLQEAIRDLK